MNKTNSEKMETVRKWTLNNTEGSHTASGSTPREAFDRVMSKIELWFDHHAHISTHIFYRNKGPYTTDPTYFRKHGGNFTFVMLNGKDGSYYWVDGTVFKDGKQWKANAKSFKSEKK